MDIHLAFFPSGLDGYVWGFARDDQTFACSNFQSQLGDWLTGVDWCELHTFDATSAL